MVLVTADDISKTFMVYGPIMNVRLPVWGHTNNLKGFGYVEYKREDSAEIAVKKSGSLSIKDRQISVDYEVGEAKTGFIRNEKKKKKQQSRSHK
jgi:RNA recognition motif-containing protein